MVNIILYFQVHQPARLFRYTVLDIGASKSYFDDKLNSAVIDKISEKCYLKMNGLLTDLINTNKGQFKIAFSITGAFVDQLRRFRPDVLESFRELARTGHVEFIGETYYHSISFLFDEIEFIEQVNIGM